jgi:hypothetical protein
MHERGAIRNEALDMKFVKFLPTLAAAAVALLLSSQAGSVPPDKWPPPPDYDVKSYSGSACQPMSGYEAYAGYIPGGIRNADPVEPLLVVCPIVRDDVEGTDGTREIVVSLYQGAQVGPCSCLAFSYAEDYELIEYVTAYAVDFGETTLSLVLEESVPDGYYDLMCALMPGSTLYSYRVSEWQGEYGDMTDYNR